MIQRKFSHIALLAAGLGAALCVANNSVAQPAPDRVTLTGWISCTTCFEPNACKAQTRWSCTQSRVAEGASYVLVVNEKHYVLSGLEKELAKAAAENSVTITGDLTGYRLAVANVDIPAKKHREQ